MEPKKRYKKLTCSNDFGKSITMGRGLPVVLNSIEGLSGAKLEMETSNSPGQDGETIDAIWLGPKDMVIKGFIRESWDKQEQYKAALMRVFNPNACLELLLTFAGKTFHLVGARADEGVEFLEKNHYTEPQQFEISIYAVDPYWREPEEVVLLEEVSNFFSFPLEIPEEGMEIATVNVGGQNIINDADGICPVIIEIPGAMQTPYIQNVRVVDGEEVLEFIKVDTPLLESETLVINTEYGNKTVTIINDQGEQRDAFNYIDLESTFFRLHQGSNKIWFRAEVGNDDAKVKIRYQKRYAGV